jgi:hypothetical protein
MKTKPDKIRIYTVVEVWRGMAANARNFTSVTAAEAHRKRVTRRQNPAEDDVAIFKTHVRAPRWAPKSRLSRPTKSLSGRRKTRQPRINSR